jgi:hypothetical protein
MSGMTDEELKHLKESLYGKKEHPLLLGFKTNASGDRGQISWRNGMYKRYKILHTEEAEKIEKNSEAFTNWDD